VYKISYLHELFYLQYHLEYKKPVTKFPSNLDRFFLRRFTLHQVSLTIGGGGERGRARVYVLQLASGFLSFFCEQMNRNININ